MQGFFEVGWWSWGELNPRPKALRRSFLRAQTVIYIPSLGRQLVRLPGSVASSFMVRAKLTARTVPTKVTPLPARGPSGSDEQP